MSDVAGIVRLMEHAADRLRQSASDLRHVSGGKDGDGDRIRGAIAACAYGEAMLLTVAAMVKPDETGDEVTP